MQDYGFTIFSTYRHAVITFVLVLILLCNEAQKIASSRTINNQIWYGQIFWLRPDCCQPRCPTNWKYPSEDRTEIPVSICFSKHRQDKIHITLPILQAHLMIFRHDLLFLRLTIQILSVFPCIAEQRNIVTWSWKHWLWKSCTVFCIHALSLYYGDLHFPSECFPKIYRHVSYFARNIHYAEVPVTISFKK